MTRSLRLTAAVSLLAIAAAVPAAAAPDTAAALTVATSPAIPVTIANSDVRTLQARHSGQTYRVYLSRPKAEPPPGGYPVLYILDANGYFASFAQAAALQSRRADVSSVQPMVIVGIDHDSPEVFDVDRRYRDYTPASPNGTPKPIPKFKVQPPHGGADQFLDFLENEVKPLVTGLVPIDHQRQSLFGHSLGGLLVLHALATQPRAFQNFIAASPSVWWDDDHILEELRQFDAREKHTPLPARALVLVGARELADMRGGAGKAAAALRNSPVPGLTIRSEEIQYADHISIIPPAINRTLRFASSQEPWPVENADNLKK